MSLPTHYKKLVAVKSSNDLREALKIEEVALSEPQADEIVVRTRYTGVNAADYLMAAGRYLSPTPPPFDMGGESCGEIVAVGSDVAEFQPGDHIMVMLGGGYREYFTIKARHAVPVPRSAPEIVLLGVSGLTASIALEVLGEMKGGEVVLVTAAAGGTGSFAVQLAKLAGCTVIGTCGSEDKVAFLRDLGCDRPINYRAENVREVLKAEYPKGVDIVFEGVGGEMFDTCVRALAVKGRLLVIGAISEYEGHAQKVEDIRILHRLMPKSASIRAFWLMHYFRDYGREHTFRLLSLLQSGKLKASIDPTEFEGVAGAIEAIEHLYRGENLGKVVVKFSQQAKIVSD